MTASPAPLRQLLVALVCLLLPALAAAAGWQVDGAASRLGFVSIKNGSVGETHAFTRIDGAVDAAGRAELRVALDSVDTGVPIRDERMREMLFETVEFPQATIRADVEPSSLGTLAPGDRVHLPLTLSVDLHGHALELPAEVTVTGLAGGRLLVATSRPVMIDATRFALGDGIEALRAVVELKSIAAAVPVTAELVLVPAAP